MPRKASINVLVAAGNTTGRQALLDLLTTCRLIRLRIVGAGPDVAEALHNQRAAGPVQLLIIDADDDYLQDPHSWAQIHLLLPSTPILAMTAGDDPRPVEAALAAGVAAIERGPPDQETIASAIRAALQRRTHIHSELLEHGRRLLMEGKAVFRFSDGLRVDMGREQIFLRGRRVQMSPLLFRVLAYPIRNRHRTVSTAELLEVVWGVTIGSGGTRDQVKGAIRRIRHLLWPRGRGTSRIVYVRGCGYQFHDPASR